MKRCTTVLTLTFAMLLPAQAASPPPLRVISPAIDVAELESFQVLGPDGRDWSMVIDVAVAVMFDIHGADPLPPPPQYDRPYSGRVEIKTDLPANDKIWGWTDMPKQPGGKCVIHLAPIGSFTLTGSGIELLEDVGMVKLLRHENGHCNGAVHLTAEAQNKWVDPRWHSRNQSHRAPPGNAIRATASARAHGDAPHADRCDPARRLRCSAARR
jgi:hypothetical protein